MRDTDFEVSYFGIEILRDNLLTKILGEEGEGILYWAGKQLAREYPLATIEEIIEFFKKASWGNLIFYKQSKKRMIVYLDGDIVKTRMKKYETANFSLESGFIAQQIEQQKGQIAESMIEIMPKKTTVIFRVLWDDETIIEN